MTSLFYFYGITQGPARGPKEAPCVDGRGRLRTELVDGLSVWFSEVDSGTFGDHLSERLEDLEWLAGAGVRHQQTIAAIAAIASVVPARFGTVFQTLQSLRDHVSETTPEAREKLDKVADADEWGIKVFRRTTPTPKPPSAVSGTDYLLQKASLRKQAGGQLAADIEQFARDLSNAAAASSAVGKVSDAQARLEWQATFLVKRARKASWDAVLQRYAQQWQESREIVCTGPWPPYSFV